MNQQIVSIVAVITLGLPVIGFAAEKKVVAKGAKKAVEKPVAAAADAPAKLVGEG